jgi:hypothetical protein
MRLQGRELHADLVRGHRVARVAAGVRPRASCSAVTAVRRAGSRRSCEAFSGSWRDAPPRSSRLLARVDRVVGEVLVD